MKRYTVSDGKLILQLEEAAEGGYIVTSPIDPGLTTQGETISEAFENARDALAELRAHRAEQRQKIQAAGRRAKRRTA